MYRWKQVWIISASNFRRWRFSPQIWLAFALGFIASFLLSNKVVLFSEEYGTVLGMLEPFIWTFGDVTSILVISLCLLLLFADMPSMDSSVPLLLVRTSRKIWLAGQILYLIISTFLFVLFVLLSTCVLCGRQAFTANMWSDTAAILGYSTIGSEIAIPAFVKVLEFTFPYQCTGHIFLLVLGYSLFISSFIFYFNLFKGKAGMVAGVVVNGFGLFLTPKIISSWFHIPETNMVKANIIFGWLSPLNHATYYMHNFGYDELPRLWMSYVFFAATSLIMFVLSFMKIRKYPFSFTGTER